MSSYGAYQQCEKLLNLKIQFIKERVPEPLESPWLRDHDQDILDNRAQAAPKKLVLWLNFRNFLEKCSFNLFVVSADRRHMCKQKICASRK